MSGERNPRCRRRDTERHQTELASTDGKVSPGFEPSRLDKVGLLDEHEVVDSTPVRRRIGWELKKYFDEESSLGRVEHEFGSRGGS